MQSSAIILHGLMQGSLKLEETADLFYTQIKPKKIKPIMQLPDLLQTSFVIGEWHNTVIAKNFLIRNMAALKAAGFNNVFVEGFYYEDQAVLDDYFLSAPSAPMSEKLNQYLQTMDASNHPPHARYDLTERWRDNNYRALITAAKQVGMRVIGVDIKVSIALTQLERNAEGKPKNWALRRRKFMNFTANHIIADVVNASTFSGKWILLTGALHTKTVDQSVLGIADILGVPCLNLQETSGLILQQTTVFNSQKNTEEIYKDCLINEKSRQFYEKKVVYEANITCNPFREMPLITQAISIEEADANLPTLKEDQFNQAMQNYLNYKDSFFGYRWYRTSVASRQVMLKIIQANNGNERYALAKQYVAEHPGNAFARQLLKVL